MKKSTLRVNVSLLLLIILTSCTSTYPGRYLFYGSRPFKSQEKHPAKEINAGRINFQFQEDANRSIVSKSEPATITYRSSKGELTENLYPMLEKNQTVAFMVIKDDVIIDEKYFDGYQRESLLPSFSVAKSITSALIGIAVDEGLISDIDLPVREYLPDFKDAGPGKITIRNLLEMNSGLEHTIGFAPWTDFARSSFHPDAVNIALNQNVILDPGETFTYNNYHTVLLGLLLQKVTGMRPSSYLEKKIWKPLGMEHNGFWNQIKENDLEIMAGGIRASIIDYARFARLFLREGDWEGRQIISREWIVNSTTTDPSIYGPEDYYVSGFDDLSEDFTTYFRDKGGYYAWHWWGYKNGDGTFDYYAFGIHGQYLYVCPGKKLIIIRFGTDFGDVAWWPEVLRTLAFQL